MKKSERGCIGGLSMLSGAVYLAGYCVAGVHGFAYAVIGWSLVMGAFTAILNGFTPDKASERASGSGSLK